MSDAKLDLDEFDVDTDLNENDEESEKLLSNLDVLAQTPICRLFRPFCSLLACSRRAVGDAESGSWVAPQM